MHHAFHAGRVRSTAVFCFLSSLRNRALTAAVPCSYDVGAIVETELNHTAPDGFNVTGVECSSGYEGAASAVTCGGSGDYSFTGCTGAPPSRACCARAVMQLMRRGVSTFCGRNDLHPPDIGQRLRLQRRGRRPDRR